MVAELRMAEVNMACYSNTGYLKINQNWMELFVDFSGWTCAFQIH